MKSISQAVILAGGQGLRLRPLTLTSPKPMILIYEKPFLLYLIELLKKNGIREIILLVGYLHEQIEDYFKDGRELGVSIKYSYSPVEANTGTRIKRAQQFFDKHFLLMYADNYWPLSLKRITDFYQKMRKKVSLVVFENKKDRSKHNLRMNKESVITAYDKTRKLRHLNGLDIGFFLVDKTILQNLPDGNFSFEEVIIPRLIKKRELVGFRTHEAYYSLTSIEKIPLLEKYFKENKLI